MKTKRVIYCYIAFVLLANALLLRLWYLTNSSELAQAAARQQSYTVTIARQRPDFFDRFGEPLTGEGTRTLAVLFPDQTASWNAAAFLDEDGLKALEEGMKGDMPFALQLAETPPQWALSSTVSLRQRLCGSSLLTHLIGYTDAEGKGVCGLERAFEPYLSANTVALQLRLTVDAVGGMVQGSEAELIAPQQQAAGIRLAVDRDVQRIAEQAADRYIQRGAVVVLDVQSGDILAWVSRPDYNRLNVAAELSRSDGALLDRVTLPYPAGSVYKVVVAAAALEAGTDPMWPYVCSGSIEVDGVQFQCNNGTAHGALTMETALCCSCNCYFIALGQQLGAAPIVQMARQLGLGSAPQLCSGFESGAGNLPAETQLQSAAQLALHCFGQGQLLVTPLQTAAMMRAVAAGGSYVSPQLVLGVGGEAAVRMQPQQAMAQENAAILSGFLAQVVQQGTGRAGMPQSCTAAAKTGTAQTGQFDESGKERLIGWYGGWFPAEEPEYVTLVMMEGVTYGSADAGPVFAAIADALMVQNGEEQGVLPPAVG